MLALYVLDHPKYKVSPDFTAKIEAIAIKHGVLYRFIAHTDITALKHHGAFIDRDPQDKRYPPSFSPITILYDRAFDLKRWLGDSHAVPDELEKLLCDIEARRSKAC